MIDFISLLFLFSSVNFLPFANGKDITLRDIVSSGQNSALYDSLSAVIREEYKGKEEVGNDETVPVDQLPIEHTVSIGQLNANYSDILFEHDIRMGPRELTELLSETLDGKRRAKRQAYRTNAYPSMIWNTGVPYAFHPKMSNYKRRSILAAINFYRKNTCIKFYPRTKEMQYLYFVGHDDGCWSTVGRDLTQGQQWISIGDGCEPFGISSHEVAHALGLFHEQSRYDRDKYIRVLFRRIPTGLEYNFGKVGRRRMRTYNIPYELGSVMHYGPTEFSKIPDQASVIAKNPNYLMTMGSLTGPTFLDTQLINIHYQCHVQCPKRIKCQNGGYQNPNSCEKCICPDGFGGTACARRARPSVKGCGGVLRVTHQRRRFRLHIKARSPLTINSSRRCIYHLLAPRGRRIQMTIKSMRNTLCEYGCYSRALEVKASRDKRLTGQRFCCGKGNIGVTSADNHVPLILFTGAEEVQVVITYQIKKPHRRVKHRGNATQTLDDPDYTEDAEVYQVGDADEGTNEFEDKDRLVAHDTEDFDAEMDGLDVADTDLRYDGLDELEQEESDPIVDPVESVTEEEITLTNMFDVPIDVEAVLRSLLRSQQK